MRVTSGDISCTAALSQKLQNLQFADQHSSSCSPPAEGVNRRVNACLRVQGVPRWHGLLDELTTCQAVLLQLLWRTGNRS